MWAVFTDEEAVDLLDAAAEMAAAALAARSKRVDEDGVIKRSADMSRIKLATLRSAFQSAPLITWDRMDDAQRDAVIRAVSMFNDHHGEAERAALWKTIQSLVLQSGPEEPKTRGSEPWGDDDLPKPAIRAGAADAAPPASALRKVRRKPRD